MSSENLSCVKVEKESGQGEFVLATKLAASKKILDTTGHLIDNPV